MCPRRAEKRHALHGRSVKPDSIKELMALPDVDGALVGGAGLTVPSFAAIVDASR
jgi:triosephosphate isomerase (TIM)